MLQREIRTSFALEDWFVEPEFNRLTRNSVSHQVEPKMMGVLLYLAEHPQHVLSKSDILAAVWPHTYVGEDALTRCISALRRVLGDDPHHPRFIKTVSKAGYCLLVEPASATSGSNLDQRPPERSFSSHQEDNFVQEPNSPPVQPQAANSRGKSIHLSAHQEESGWNETVQPSGSLAPGLGPAPVPPQPRNALTSAPNEPIPPPQGQSAPGPRLAPLALALVALAIASYLWQAHRFHQKASSLSFQTFRLTTDPGEQTQPAFSPDGLQLAFVSAAEGLAGQQIFVKVLGQGHFSTEPVHRLTQLTEDEFNPVWSPDARSIAFLASSDSELSLYIASLEHPEAPRKVYIPGENTRWDQGALSWSPDGRSLILADHIGQQASSSIYLIDLQTLRARALTSPPPGWEGDLSPAYSPDGQKIAFVRASESEVTNLYWMAVGGGEPHQITRDGKLIKGIAWSADSQSVVFSSDRGGQYALWKAGIPDGQAQRVPIGTEDATQPALSLGGNSLAFVQSAAQFGILRIGRDKNPASAGASQAANFPIVSSTESDSAPSVAPDGSRFAFQSSRSGGRQIWLASLDGQLLRQLTAEADALSFAGSPSWSPSGDLVTFDARCLGHSHIFTIPPDGGSPRQLTFGDVNDTVPRWSANGRFLYFRSNRGGRWQLWKVSSAGGPPLPVTRDDGIAGQESPDGKWLYFARAGEKGIWRMPVAGGEAVRILDQPAAGFWGYWCVAAHSLYFLDNRALIPVVSIADLSTGRSHPFVRLDHQPPPSSGISLIPARQDLLISDKHNTGSHISLAKGAF